MSSCKHTILLDPEKYNNIINISPTRSSCRLRSVSYIRSPSPPSVTNECEPFSIIIHASTSCCSPPPPATGARAWEGTPRLISQSSGAARNYEFREIFHCRPPILVGGALHCGRMKKVDHTQDSSLRLDSFSQHTRNKIITDNKEYVLEVQVRDQNDSHRLAWPMPIQGVMAVKMCSGFSSAGDKIRNIVH